ncbi:MAG: hypothetical protein FH749_09775 [Firmicutes bacterium]|nr:hypothetical protein [Bacillota bacterium]
MLTVLTWNMDHWKRKHEQRREAWEYLTEVIRSDIALLQECVPPDNLPGYHVIYREIGGSRKWGSAILTRFPAEEVEFDNSHPGAVVAAEVTLPGRKNLTVISLYGVMSRLIVIQKATSPGRTTTSMSARNWLESW